VAIYLDILKTHVDGEEVEYTFSTTDGRTGRLRINRNTGQVRTVEQMPGDSLGAGAARAARKVTLAWNDGHLPDKLVWAS